MNTRLFCFFILRIWLEHLTLDAQSQKGENNSPVILTAPEFYQSLIPRLSPHPSFLYQNLLYEGNNDMMRGLNETYPHESAGMCIAEHWRHIVVHTRGTFVLRDALFSQQDHPYRFSPFALMLPANWIPAAAAQSGDILSLAAPERYDDSAWFAIHSPKQMFGSFPPSKVLFSIATRRDTSITDSSLIYNARETIGILAGYAQRLIDRRKNGVRGMIQEGADIIAQSDSLYFGRDIRRHHVIPIMVENPTLHEMKEGKGITIVGRRDISQETTAAVRRACYRRRLNDGDIAIERYDLSNPTERKRAIRVLRELIPRGSSGATVWLWVTGRLRAHRIFEGEDALKYIDRFRREVKEANIEESRLNYVSKPSLQISRTSTMKRALDSAMNQIHRLRLPVSINITSDRLKQLLGTE